MKASDIRKKWLDFFAEKGHHIEPSASLVPHNDPSLLWINAGMAPLKPFFDGRMKPDNPRIANSQKCIRTNDIENVGKTRRHHTFFEMLGNFSIGDYFKKEAIHWAWEFLTDPQWIGFDQDRLYVTIHPDDDEAYAIWHEDVGLPADHIGKLEENFWDLGGGPCGPCSEIFYDRGEAYGVLDNDPEMFPGGENERYLEIWNLVFTQFNHNQDGSLTPLPNKNIDTGAGLERLASVLQEVDSNFDTDLFLPIIRETAQLAEVTYGDREEVDTALKVIADHIRTGVFAIGDGVLPSNEGRGYVIRRLLRRAVRYGKVLGIHEPFMHRLVSVVGQIMGVYYAEVVDKRELIEQVIRTEEERFHETLGDGLMILEQICADVKQRGARKISGEESFKLYDTYGFPLDLTEDYAAEVGLGIDHAGFEQAMEEQRNRARAARQDDGSMNVQSETLSKLQVTSEFVGYTEWITESSVVSLLKDGEIISQCDEGQTCQVILDRTPFYAQSGGQVSDCGTIRSPRMLAEVTEVNKAPNGQHVHTVTIQEGTLHQDDVITAEIVRETREEIIKNHTATHLLHQALKDVLGDHVNQAGSLVAPDRLRFDFSHFNAITDEQLMQLEQQVNQQIWLNTPLNIELKPLEEAKQMGAMALFGEKYGEIVRIVQIGEYSLELCGGCHVEQTGQIGQFKIVSEAGIGSGVRRIEAITGKHAYEYMEDKARLLNQVADQLKTTTDDLPKRMDSLLEQLKELERENESLRNKLGRIEASSLINQVEEINGIQVLTAQLDGMNMDGLRNIVDEMKERLGSAIIVVGAAVGNKVQLVAAVTPDLVKRSFHAGKLIKEAAQICGGGGGGRPDMAQAGGNEPAKLKEALAYVKSLLK